MITPRVGTIGLPSPIPTATTHAPLESISATKKLRPPAKKQCPRNVPSGHALERSETPRVGARTAPAPRPCPPPASTASRPGDPPPHQRLSRRPGRRSRCGQGPRARRGDLRLAGCPDAGQTPGHGTIGAIHHFVCRIRAHRCPSTLSRMTVIPRSVARPLRGLSRLKHHAIRSRNRRRVPASRGVVNVTSAVRDEFPRQLSPRALSLCPTPLPGRHGVRLRPQASLRCSDSRFKLRQRTDIRSMLAIPPGQAHPDQFLIEHPAIGQHHIAHNTARSGPWPEA